MVGRRDDGREKLVWKTDHSSCLLPVCSFQCTVHSGPMVPGNHTENCPPRKITTHQTNTMAYPINMNRTIAAVMRAPRLAGDNIPNIANTLRGR